MTTTKKAHKDGDGIYGSRPLPKKTAARKPAAKKKAPSKKKAPARKNT